MARRRATLDLESLLQTVDEQHQGLRRDELDEQLLDTALGLLQDLGLRRWTMDDVAARAGVGRTTLYRRFESRDALVIATLARSIEQLLAALAVEALDRTSLIDQVTSSMISGIARFRDSVFGTLLHSDPDLVLPLLTTAGGPLHRAARTQLSRMALTVTPTLDPARTEAVAEALVRIASSLVLAPDTILIDERGTDGPLRSIVAALLAAGAAVGDQTSESGEPSDSANAPRRGALPGATRAPSCEAGFCVRCADRPAGLRG